MNIEVYLSKIVEAVTLMIGWYYYRNLSKPFKIFVIYISISVLTGFLERFLVSAIGSNLILYHFYNPIEFILITIGILLLLNFDNLKIRAIIIIPYLIFWLFAKLTFESFDLVPNKSVAVANSIIFLLAVFGSLKISLSSFGSIFRDPRITMLIGVLTYFGGSIIIFTLSNLIFSEGDLQAKLLWKIHNGLYIGFNLLIIYSFNLSDKKTSKAE